MNTGKQFMKTTKVITSWVGSLLLITLGLAFSGCASARHTDMESMLSDSGFRAETPRTAQQQASYAAMPANELQRQEINGEVAYVYADKNADLVYIGNERNYQSFQQMAYEQEFAAVDPIEDPMVGWRTFWQPGPENVW